ncbi:MAG: phosphodiester glycosidase family protein [Oscillospiraceae bacterium]|nr:phosphodiester glycosidase family protein [Oscillospiraceae bacterium]
MKKYSLFPICYGIALTAFTVYLSLDTFVLRDAYQTDIAEMNTSMFENISVSAETNQSVSESETNTEAASESQKHGKKHHQNDSVSDTTEAVSEQTAQNLSDLPYQDENIQINLTEYYENNTKIYVADIQLTSAEYLKTAFAEDTYGKNITAKTSAIASAHHAILAINGDYYGAQEKGCVIRNGIVYRNTQGSNDVLCIYADGTLKIISPDEYTAEELAAQGVWQAFSFGPGLIEDSQITVTQNQEVGKAMASNPRTAVGIIEPNHYVFVVSDGRTTESEGLSLYQLAQFMQKLGVTTAYNLDGGGSSTMCFNGEVINHPTTTGNIKERGVSDIVYIG